ncbi:hypothetical protein KPH14_009804 [Odynerus spinipes]|uniref:Uncharacterized protein n=1 Tax=Odynerus spinipes TaxID=1348599 RepID=A0AAD9RVV0_9HYME|nr:hypothetical protein KPH14_009804 [Odynerus spinipes]
MFIAKSAILIVVVAIITILGFCGTNAKPLADPMAHPLAKPRAGSSDAQFYFKKPCIRGIVNITNHNYHRG